MNGIEKFKPDIILAILKKAVRDNDNPKFIKAIINSSGLGKMTIATVKKEIKHKLLLEWDELENSWQECDEMQINLWNMSNLVEPLENKAQVSSPSVYFDNKFKRLEIKRLEELCLELAIDEDIKNVENKDIQIIINNMETILKDMKALQSKINQIAKNFNKLTDCLK